MESNSGSLSSVARTTAAEMVRWLIQSQSAAANDAAWTWSDADFRNNTNESTSINTYQGMSNLTDIFNNITINTNNHTGNRPTNATAAPLSPPTVQRDAYEFVAFLLWYIFLVMCCVIPTCCAYRRRRLVEARMAQHHANISRLQQSNSFILSSLQNRHDSTFTQEERMQRITEELKKTSMVRNSCEKKDAQCAISDSVQLTFFVQQFLFLDNKTKRY
jgi:hypothetical protein